ncbi:MAG: NapC/NirT family cytochrome c [Candidatus Latescibacteria bacterium]|jgi:fumarate reductase subunit C|nr:NapC/NirT family cytochrome c [Candidatus Latescibacterota bacterium]
MASRRLPDIFYNWISMVGALMAIATFSVIVLLLLIDRFVQGTTIYLGLLTFLVLPVFVVLGLVLIAAGGLLDRRRQARGEVSHFPKQIEIDLENPRHRNAALIWAVGTTIFLLASAVGTYRAYQETESVAFCGTLCHSVMHPEHTAYQTSPHARVSCVACHIGPGADWFVQSKLSGLYQVYATTSRIYPKPIPTPIKNLRPARETCEQCHWPEKFFGARKDVNPHFLSDEANTPYPITMLINIGGGSEVTGRVEGIHWHVAGTNRMEYIAGDPDRKSIAWVRMTDENGEVVEYDNVEDPLTEEERASAEVRTLDCIDCHNRPSHIYRSPVRAVNDAMARRRIDPTLPYIKREAVTVLSGDYADTPSALDEIRDRLVGLYREEHPEVLEFRPEAVDSAVAAVQGIYQRNFFPEMRVPWQQYPDNIGHSEFVGCFRCHGDVLETGDGRTITKDCTVCHTILAQGLGAQMGDLSSGGVAFKHPVDIEGAEHEIPCTECHEGGAELY